MGRELAYCRCGSRRDMAAETMAQSGKGKIAADISKLRRDVLKQALASLAAFIGSVNYSESFHMSAAAQAAGREAPVAAATLVEETPATVGAFADNPLYKVASRPWSRTSPRSTSR